MAQEGERARALDFAATRYKQGRCPSCGKGFGEPRGMEYRNKALDLYCHTCRRSWPTELNLGALRDELSLLESPQADRPFVPISDLSIPQEESASTLVCRLGSFFQRIVLRHLSSSWACNEALGQDHRQSNQSALAKHQSFDIVGVIGRGRLRFSLRG